MKKMKLMAAVALISFGLSSCVVATSYTVTGNPIGTKKGISKSNLSGKAECSIRDAAKKGKITKIGSVDTKTTLVFIFPISKITVTGE